VDGLQLSRAMFFLTPLAGSFSQGPVQVDRARRWARRFMGGCVPRRDGARDCGGVVRHSRHVFALRTF
jgi:hypothetical protein